jgi:hypothetical protein
MAIEVFKVDDKSKKPSKIVFNGTVGSLRSDPISFTDNPFDRAATAGNQSEAPSTFLEYISEITSLCGKIKTRGGHNTNSTIAPSIGSSLPAMAVPLIGTVLAPISSETDWADDLSVMAYTGTEDGGGFGYLVTDGKRWMEPLMPRSANIVSHPAPNRPAAYSGIGQDRYRNGIAISPDGEYAYYGATVNGAARGDGEVWVYKLLRASKEVRMVESPIIMTAPANSGWKLGRRVRKTSNCLLIGAPGATSAHTGNTGRGMIIVMSQRENQESFIESQRITMPDGSIGRMFEVSENGEWLVVLVEGSVSEKRIEIFKRSNAGAVNGLETYMYIHNSSLTVENLFYGQIGISNNGMRILMYPYFGMDQALRDPRAIPSGYEIAWAHDVKTRIIKRTNTSSQEWITQTQGPLRSEFFDIGLYFRNMGVSFSDILADSIYIYAYGGRVKERMGLSLSIDKSTATDSSLLIQRIMTAVNAQPVDGRINRPQTVSEWELENFGEIRGVSGNNLRTPNISGFLPELENNISLINNTGSTPTSWSSENVKAITINGEGTVTKTIRVPGIAIKDAEERLVFIKTEIPGNGKRTVTIEYRIAGSVAGIDMGIVHKLLQADSTTEKSVWTADNWTVIYNNHLESITGESLQIGRSIISRGVSTIFESYDSISGLTWRYRGANGSECGTGLAIAGEDNRVLNILSMEISRDCLIPIGIVRYNNPATEYADIVEMELKITVSKFLGFSDHLKFMLADGSGYANTHQLGYQRVAYSPLTIFEGSKFDTLINDDSKYSDRIEAPSFGTGFYDSIRMDPWSFDYRPESYLAAGVFSENIGRFYRVFLEAGEGLFAKVDPGRIFKESDLLSYQMHKSLVYWSKGNLIIGAEVYEDSVKDLDQSVFNIPYNSGTHRFATIKEQELLGQLPLNKRLYSRSLTGYGTALDFVSKTSGYYWVRISSNLPVDTLGRISDFSIIRPGIIDRPEIERRMFLSALNFRKYRTTEYTKTMARPASFYLDSQFVNPLPGSIYIAATYPTNPGGPSTITLTSDDYLIKTKADLPFLGILEAKSPQESSLIGQVKDTVTFGGRYREFVFHDPYGGYDGTWQWSLSQNRYSYRLNVSGVDPELYLKRGFTMIWEMKPDGITPINQETATYGPSFWTSMQKYHGVEIVTGAAYDDVTDSTYTSITYLYNIEFFEPISLETAILYPSVPSSIICHNFSDYNNVGWVSGYVAPPNYLGLSSGQIQKLYATTSRIPVSINAEDPTIANAGYAKVKITPISGVSRTRVAIGVTAATRNPTAPLSVSDSYYAAINTLSNERSAYALAKSMDGEPIGDIEIYDILDQSTPILSFPYTGGTFDAIINNGVSFDIDFPGVMTSNREILIKLKRNQYSASIVTMFVRVAVELERIVP